MFDNPILPLVLTMWIVTCKGIGAVPGQTQQQPMPPGLRLVQVSLQQCIQVYFLILFISPEHEAIVVSGCPSSVVVCRASSVVRRPSTFDVYTLETTFVT